MHVRITPLGDRALVLELARRIGEIPPLRVHAACAHLAAAALPGVIELVPAATTLTVFYDPLALLKAGAPRDELAGWLTARVQERLAGLPADDSPAVTRIVEIPVCYGGAFGPDLDNVATRTRCGVDEVVALHRDADYVVLQLGFAPGFPYLHGLPDALRLPRRETPRTRVPAGSVAIANGQTCIYPTATAGGWHLLGRTPLRLFRPDREPSCLLQPGDRVKFHAITPEEFAQRKEGEP